MFNSYRVKYSPETHQLLNVLMDEVKLSNTYRQQVKEIVNRGESLPRLTRRRARPSYVDENLFDLKRNYYFMRRTLDQIRYSGAYERERYRLLQPIVDKEREKERLRNLMAYGKGNSTPDADEKASTCQEKRQSKRITLTERVDELIIEIQDRIAFLEEMEALGEVRKYEETIKQEIASKLRELEKIDKETAQKYIKVLGSPERIKTNMDEVLHWD